jgi:hypothetical protein
MKVVLFEWGGLNKRKYFDWKDLLMTSLPRGFGENEIIEIVAIDISQAIIDLLEVRGAGKWYIPSGADIEAELDHGDAVARRFRG